MAGETTARVAVPAGAARCRATSDSPKPLATDGAANEKYWRQMFEEIGVRSKPPPPPPKTWKDRLACFAVICLGAIIATQLGYKAYMDYHYGFTHIDVSDAPLLKEVMFGGRPWLLMCKWPNKRMKVPDAVDRSRLDLLKIFRLGRIDCGAVLQSGVTFAERFRIPSTTEGLILANGKAPRLLTPWALETKSNLLSYVERHTKLEIRTVDDNGSLRRRCMTPFGARCLMLMRAGGITTTERNRKLQVLFGAEPEVRKLKYGVIDTKKHSLSLHDVISIPHNIDENGTQLVCIVNITPKEVAAELAALRKKDDVSRQSFKASLYEGSFSETDAVKAFARACAAAGGDGFVDLPKAPTVVRMRPPSE